MVGRSPWLQPVIVDEKAGEIGDIVSVRITKPEPTACCRAARRRRAPTEETRLSAAELKNAPSGASDMAHIVLTFDNNKLASALYGQFDENLARLEQKLGVDIRSRGNQLTSGSPRPPSRRAARSTISTDPPEGHRHRCQSDVDGAIRMAVAADDQLTLPTLERRARWPRRRSRRASAPSTPARSTRTPICGRWSAPNWCSASARPAPARPISPWRTPPCCSSAGMVERIILSRPAVEAGERLGFLPGDMKEKVDPYLRPLYDALYDMMPADKVERAITAGVIEIAPLAFMRGRTLAHAAVILDEAQNTTSMQMKMFLTRLGENSRMIVTGDPTQIDLPPNTKSGLVEALRILDGVPGHRHRALQREGRRAPSAGGRNRAAYDREAKMARGLGIGRLRAAGRRPRRRANACRALRVDRHVGRGRRLAGQNAALGAARKAVAAALAEPAAAAGEAPN
jgi:phosphate starvation-inducible PhoH-like protein